MSSMWAVPRGPINLDEVIRRFPALRQSLLAKHDDCPLSSLLEVRYARGWSTHPQARGTICHRTYAECLREMQRQGSRTIPIDVALAILVEQCRQQHLPPEEIVRVPLRQMPELRMAVIKFAKDNEFTIERIVDVERRLEAQLTYPHPDGGHVTRTLTGQIDALLWDPEVQGPRGEVVKPAGAIVLDWKDTWGLPPEPRERSPEDYIGPDDELRGISYHGYFQQRFYGWLVMKNYPAVQRVTLREFYARKTKVRKATLTRDRMHEVEEELSVLVQAFDAAVAAGAPPFPYGWWPKADPETGEVVGRELDIERLGHWKPQPGKHCGFCASSRHCPIEEDARIEADGAITSWDRAKAAAAELQVVERVRTVLLKACKGFVETQGAPIPVKSSKGRRALGWVETNRGRRFQLHTPEASDRGLHADLDAQLEEAMRDAAARARATRQRPPRLKAGKV